MNDELRRARNEQAKKTFAPEWAQGIDLNSGARCGFGSGWDACLAHLADAVDEFTRDAAEKEFGPTEIGRAEFIDGARWQHAQMAARVARAESQAETYLYRMQEYAESVGVFAERIKQLESQLAAAKAETFRATKTIFEQADIIRRLEMR